jgi:hypothetical protein
MADLVQIDTDEEMDKYAEAELIASNPPPVSLLKNKKLSFNSTTRRNDVLASLSTGGYVKIGEEDISREDQVRELTRTLKSYNTPFDMADYEAAGFTAQEVEAAGVMPVTQEKSGRTEPLREGEQLRMLREGGDAAIAAPSRMFMRDDWNRGTVDVLSAIGVPAQQANQIADMVMGQVDTSGGTGVFDTGIGIIDFTPVGLAFGIEEIGDQLNRSIQADDKLGIGTGILFLALSAAEAYPLTKAGAKAVKAQIPAIRQAIADLGQSAEERIAQEGTTLFSNPVGPAVDRGLAAAGRLAEGDRPSADELRKQANIERFGYDPNETPTIKAFHGSPYSFDRFDLSFMGTGEGAQAYGKGLYFAEMEDVAKEYRDQLSGHLNAKIGGQKVIDVYNDLSAQADRLPVSDAQILYEKMAFLEDLELTSDINLSIDRIDDPEVEAWARSEVLPKFQPAGNIYEVEIKADPSELLDFDAPISEQSAKVQKAIAPFVEKRLDAIEAAGQEALKKAKELGREFTPKTRSEILSTLKGGDILLLDKVETGEVSQALKDAGVPGIKYLDRQSRGKSFEIKLSVKDKPYATEPIFATNKADAERIANDYKEKGFGVTITDVGSSNYVVLDDNLIEIVKKYGFGGLMVGAGVQSGLGVKESFEEA